MSPRKKIPMPDITETLGMLESHLRVRFFPIKEIPSAVVWAERGNIAVHENYHSKRRRSFHVISGERDGLVRFCKVVGLPDHRICASEFYRFWHLTWHPGDMDEGAAGCGSTPKLS